MSWKPVEPKDYFKYKCPKCSNTITSILGDKAQYIVCRDCNKLLHNNEGHIFFVAQFKRTIIPAFPLGSIGKFNNKKFQLIGALEVKEDKTSYYWREYIIKYEDETIAYFMEYDGHWSYVEQIPDSIKAKAGANVFYNDEEYTFFNSYKTVNVAALGDFFWNVTGEEKPRIHEYINPPYGLVAEYKKNQTNWYKSEYIRPSKMKDVFDGDSGHNLPKRTGVYSIQPLPLPVKKNVLIELSLVYVFFMTVIIALLMYVNNERVVFDMKQDLNQSTYSSNTLLDSTQMNQPQPRRSEIMDRGVYYPDSNVFISEPFKISSKFNSAALEVNLSAPVSNNWFEASCQLINENSGQEYFFEIGVEYYFGPDWTEGSKDNDIVLSEIPDGNYRMIIKPYVGTEGGMQLSDYRISIIQDKPLWSNFFILLLGVLAVPIGMIIYANNFNASKWYNSNLTQ
jgi:hypothetical protein